MDTSSLVIASLGVLSSIGLSLLGSFVYVRQVKADLQKELEVRFNEKKWQSYTKFTDKIRRILAIEDPVQSARLFQHLETELQDFASEFLLIASDDVVKEFAQWRILYSVNGPRDDAAVKQLFSLIVQMRIDLGNTTTELDYQDLLPTLVPNYQRSM